MLMLQDMPSALSISAMIVVALTTIYLVFWKKLKARLESTKPFEELPMARDSHFLLGHLGSLGLSFHEQQYRLSVESANEHGQCGYWLLSQKCVAVSNWQDARKIWLNETGKKQPAIVKTHMGHFLGIHNILVVNGREWKVHRNAITRAFLPMYDVEYQKSMRLVMHDLVKALKAAVSEKECLKLDMNEVMKMYTLDVFGLCGMDTDFGCCRSLQPSRFATSFDVLTGELTRRLKRPLDPFCYFYDLPTKQNRLHAKEFQSIRSFLNEKLRLRRQTMSSENTTGADKTEKEGEKDLLSRLIEGHLMAKEQLSEDVPDEALTDIIMSLFFAGYETTSVALTYALYLLDQHPDVEEALLEEIQSLGESSLDNKPEDFVYCKAIVMETLRLYPPAYAVTRNLKKPIQLSGGFRVPKETLVLCPIWVLHRKSWPEPESFRPDRWAQRQKDRRWVERGQEEEDGDNNNNDESGSGSGTIPAANRKAFFAFTVGGRSCPGASFALQEAVMILAGLIKNFKFRVEPGYTLCPKQDGVVQHPKGGMPMRVEVRS